MNYLAIRSEKGSESRKNGMFSIPTIGTQRSDYWNIQLVVLVVDWRLDLKQSIRLNISQPRR